MELLKTLGLTAAIFAPVAILIVWWFNRAEKQAEAAEEVVAQPNKRWLAYQERLRVALSQADLRFTTQRFMMLQLGAAVAGLVLGLLSTPSPALGVLIGILLAFAAWRGSWAYLSWAEKRQQTLFLDQFAEAVGLIGNAVKSGLSVLQAFELVAKEMPNPISTEMATVLQAVRIGIPLDVAMEDWSTRIDSDDLRMFVTAISLQRTTGGPLSEILDVLGDTVRERRRIQGQIRTSTAQGRASAWVLCLLPVFFLIAMYLMNPEYIGLFFQHPLGMVMLAVGAGLDLIGLFFIRRIIAIDF